MPISKIIFIYLLTAVVFFAIDMLWLGLLAKNLYQKHLGHLMGDVNWVAALVFYLFFIAGILIFSIFPAVEKDSVNHALLYGALFGFFTYATYDLTNLATLKDWPVTIVFIDIPWGVFLTGSVSLAGFYIAKWLGG